MVRFTATKDQNVPVPAAGMPAVPRTTAFLVSCYRSVLCISADCAMARCPSAHLSHAGIVSKRLNVLSNVSHTPVATHSSFFSTPNTVAIFQLGPDPTNGGIKCSGRPTKSRDFRPIRYVSEMIQNCRMLIGTRMRSIEWCCFQ